MKIRKNLEGVFLVAAAMTIVATYATAMPAPRVHSVPAVSAEMIAPMATVEVHAKRLSAAEKLAAN